MISFFFLFFLDAITKLKIKQNNKINGNFDFELQMLMVQSQMSYNVGFGDKWMQ